MTKSTNYPVRTTQKSIRILEAIYRTDGGTLTELASELEMNKSTIHNHLHTLIEDELVVRNGSDYRLGLRLLEFGGYARHQHDFYQVAISEIKRLADQTEELANLVVEEHGRSVYLACESGVRSVTLDDYPGIRRPMHVTAAGKAILAHLPTERVDEIVDRHGLPEKTPQSITTRKELDASLAEVRERGVAIDNEEHTKGLRCIAAPVVDSTNQVVGAVSISGPASRMDDSRLIDEMGATVSSAANVIELSIS